VDCIVTDHWIDAPGGRLFARRWTPSADGGAAAPLLLLHDSLGCVELWRGFPLALARASGRSVIAYDRLGFGRSGARQGKLPVGFIDDEALVNIPLLCACFGFERFVVFGHSVGGGMAVHAAAAFPEDCIGLVTESAQSFVEERTRAGILEAKAQFARPGAMERLARYHGDKAPWVLAAWTDTWLSPAFSSWTLDAVLPRVACPVLVLHGEDDEYGSPAQPARIARGVAGPVECVLLPGVRHLPHREQEAAVAGRVAAFTAALPARRP